MFQQRFLNLPPVVKTILIANIVLFIISYIWPELQMQLAIYSLKSKFFHPYQFITHMFMHGGFWHLFFNMFSLYMFGSILEEVWGSKRFFIYYFVTGLGAAFLHLFIAHLEINSLIKSMNPQAVDKVLNEGANILMMGKNYTDTAMGNLNSMINIPTVGASGAIYGLLLAFGVLFPNTILYLYAAIPVKAKYLVIAMIVIELVLGFLNRSGDNVAHFAHLGGMLFGLIFILIWRKKQFNRWN